MKNTTVPQVYWQSVHKYYLNLRSTNLSTKYEGEKNQLLSIFHYNLQFWVIVQGILIILSPYTFHVQALIPYNPQAQAHVMSTQQI